MLSVGAGSVLAAADDESRALVPADGGEDGGGAVSRASATRVRHPGDVSNAVKACTSSCDTAVRHACRISSCDKRLV